MRAVESYKKCMRCGDKYRIESQLTKCMCGGHLYVAGLIYQEKPVCSRIAPAQPEGVKG